MIWLGKWLKLIANNINQKQIYYLQKYKHNLDEIHKYEYGIKNIDPAIENKKEKNNGLQKYYCDIYSKNINKYDEKFSEFIDEIGVYALNNDNKFVIELGIIAKLLEVRKDNIKKLLEPNFKKGMLLVAEKFIKLYKTYSNYYKKKMKF
jgi:hypothetical protein